MSETNCIMDFLTTLHIICITIIFAHPSQPTRTIKRPRNAGTTTAFRHVVSAYRINPTYPSPQSQAMQLIQSIITTFPARCCHGYSRVHSSKPNQDRPPKLTPVGIVRINCAAGVLIITLFFFLRNAIPMTVTTTAPVPLIPGRGHPSRVLDDARDEGIFKIQKHFSHLIYYHIKRAS